MQAIRQHPILALLGLILAVQLVRSVLRRREIRRFKRTHACEEPPAFPQREYIFGYDAWKALTTERAERRILPAAMRRSQTLGRTNSIVFMGQKYMVTSDEENIRAAYSVQAADYGIDCRLSYMKPLLGEGIFTLEGPKWQHSRVS